MREIVLFQASNMAARQILYSCMLYLGIMAMILDLSKICQMLHRQCHCQGIIHVMGVCLLSQSAS